MEKKRSGQTGAYGQIRTPGRKPVSGQAKHSGRTRASDLKKTSSQAKAPGRRPASGQISLSGQPKGSRKSRRVKKKHPLLKALFQAALLAVLVAGILGFKKIGLDQLLGGEKQRLRMAGIEKMDSGDYGGAVADFDAAVEASRGKSGAFEIDVLNYRAEAEYMLQDYQAAAHTYDTLRQIDGERVTYWYRSAVVKAMAGDLDGGLEAYKNGAALEKEEGQLGNMVTSGSFNSQGSLERAKALEAVGQACSHAGRRDEANELYGDAIRDGAADAFIFNAMGLTYLESGRYKEALDCFDQAILEGAEEKTKGSEMAELSGRTGTDVDETIKQASFNRAVSYEYMRQYQKAIQCFEDYITEFGPDEAAQKEILFLQTR